jgi:dihydroflavonol-4-reductase
VETAFLTGATGFIGSHVALELMDKGWRVRALRRSDTVHPMLLHTDIQWLRGDIRDYDQVYRAMASCDAVFHVAADYRLWARNPRDLYETNVNGTENVLKAALAHGVRRVVYTSSVGALGLNPDGSPSNELTPVRLEDMVGHYKRSKFLAERKAEEFAASGLPLIIVNPSTPVGAGDLKPTPTGKIVVDFLNGRMPAYLNTGLNLVHVKDVARGHLLALEKGRIGEKYILGNRNLTLSEIFRMLQRISGIRAPRVRLPYTPILFLAYLALGLSKLTRKEPAIPFEGVKMARKYMFFDPAKAVQELGMPQTPVDAALEDAVTWFYQNGYALGRAKTF